MFFALFKRYLLKYVLYTPVLKTVLSRPSENKNPESPTRDNLGPLILLDYNRR